MRIQVNFKKNKILYIIISISIISFATIILKGIIPKHSDFFNKIYNNSDIHYSLISLNAVIAGFLFTGVGLILTLLGNQSVKRLWDNGYMDNMYHSIIVSIFMHIISVMFGFMCVFDFIEDKYSNYIAFSELFFALTGIILFCLSTIELVGAINVFKRKN